MKARRITHHEASALERNEQELMRIECYAVSEMQTSQSILPFLSQYSKPCIRSVYVQPQVMSAAELRYVLDWIDGTGVGGSRTRHNSEWMKSALSVSFD